MFKAIAAVAENGVIGNGNAIPWRISEDFKHFKKTTVGGVVVMGRKTWESIGSKPLPLRENVVVTSRPDDIRGAKAYKSLGDVERAYAGDARPVWIIGGARLYKAALDKCDELVISRVHLSPEGDAHFPEFKDKFELSETLLKHPEFDVVRYVRKRK